MLSGWGASALEKFYIVSAMNANSTQSNSDRQGNDRSHSNQIGGGLLENRRAILVLLWAVTGCLGLPLLWISPKFTATEKFIYSVLVTIYTLILIAIAAGTVWWAYARIMGY